MSDFGLDPTVNEGGAIVLTGKTITRRGTPIVAVPNTAFGVDYRALFARRKDYRAAGLTYTVQFSADLTTWESSMEIPTVVASDALMDAVTVPYPLLLQSGAKARYFHVRITAP